MVEAVKLLSDYLEDMKVGTVIVKDQSRLGRDHLETDRLLELVFPSYDVRFIAITDGVDSANGFNDMTTMRNWFNDFYARDTSKKIRAVQIFKDTHEAIVDRTTFDLVQKHFEGRKRPDKLGEMDKYAGYLYCGECGSRMYLHHGRTIEPSKNNLFCGTYQNHKTECTAHYIRESVLDEIVLTALSEMTAYAREHSEEFYQKYTANGENAAAYEQEQVEIRAKLAKLENEIDSAKLRKKCISEFIAKAKEYVEMPKLTPELLRTFIKRIEVYEKEVKYSRTCGNRIRIKFTFEPETAVEIKGYCHRVRRIKIA